MMTRLGVSIGFPRTIIPTATPKRERPRVTQATTAAHVPSPGGGRSKIYVTRAFLSTTSPPPPAVVVSTAEAPAGPISTGGADDLARRHRSRIGQSPVIGHPATGFATAVYWGRGSVPASLFTRPRRNAPFPWDVR